MTFEHGVVNLPSQTPLFHAVNRDRYERHSLIKQIEEFTGRRLLVYISNLSHPQNSITREDIPPFSELIASLEDNSEIDLIIQSPGGDPNAAETMVNSLLAKTNNLRVIIPQAAKSAATMISLCADVILMSDTSELGPIDPQIPIRSAHGYQMRPAQAFLNGLERIKSEHSNGQQLNPAYWPFLQGVDAALIDFCEKSILHSKNLAVKWLMRSMETNYERALKIAEEQTDIERYPNHGAVISYSEVQNIGLNVEYVPYDSDIWQLMWRLYIRYTVEMREKSIVKVFESKSTSVLI